MYCDDRMLFVTMLWGFLCNLIHVNFHKCSMYSGKRVVFSVNTGTKSGMLVCFLISLGIWKGQYFYFRCYPFINISYYSVCLLSMLFLPSLYDLQENLLSSFFLLHLCHWWFLLCQFTQYLYLFSTFMPTFVLVLTYTI